MLPTLKRLARPNARGTYFSRLIHFPGPDGPVNQLDAVITRLRSETAKKGSGTGPLTACYEAGFTDARRRHARHQLRGGAGTAGQGART